MARLRVHHLTVSVDGYAAGPDQGPEHPLAVAAANGRDVAVGGGPDTIRQYLRAGLVDEVAEFTPSEAATHVCLVRS